MVMCLLPFIASCSSPHKRLFSFISLQECKDIHTYLGIGQLWDHAWGLEHSIRWHVVWPPGSASVSHRMPRDLLHFLCYCSWSFPSMAKHVPVSQQNQDHGHIFQPVAYCLPRFLFLRWVAQMHKGHLHMGMERILVFCAWPQHLQCSNTRAMEARNVRYFLPQVNKMTTLVLPSPQVR